MAPPTRSSARAPKSRVYSSAPAAPRQKRFRASGHNARIRSSDTSAIRKKRQSTLTQLDFADLDQDSADEAANDDPEEQAYAREVARAERIEARSDSETEDWEQPPAKRRRTRQCLTAAQLKRQQTLTQMDGFLTSEDWQIREDDMDYEMNDENQRPAEDSPQSNQPRTTPDHPQSPQNPPATAPLPRPLPRSPRSQAHSSPRTPRKPFKAEIPSSQSPSATPLSRRLTPSPYKSLQRTPLSEIHQNIISMRDMENVSSEKSNSKRKPAKVETQDGHSEMFSDNENYMPDSDDDSDVEVGAGSPTKSIKHTDFIKPSLPRVSSLTPSRLRHVASSPRSVSSPISHGAEQTIRTSQASTVEFVSPRHVGSRSASNNHVRGPSFGSRMANESSPPYRSSPLSRGHSFAMDGTADSTLPPGLLDNVTQIASINDSADIVTASQIMDSSP